jgi:hypothetical protein
MTKKKRSATQKQQTQKAALPQIPAVPPPDDPMLRSTEFDSDREYHSKEMAEKRLEAIQDMPTSDEETQTSPESQTPNSENGD